MTHCDIQGGYVGTGNINADPSSSAPLWATSTSSPAPPALARERPPARRPRTRTARPTPPSIGAYEAASAGRTHLLWTSTDGTAAIWTLDSAGNVTSTPALGPISGWTAKSIADGSDGQTRLLWTKADGTNAVWTVNDADGSMTSTPAYGPYAGWQVAALAVGPDNLARLQWKRSPDGMSSFWTVAADGSVTSTPGYGPYGPSGRWTAAGLAVGQDGLSHLLWDNSVTGQFSVWTFEGSGGLTSTPALGRAFEFPLRAFADCGRP